VDELNADPPCRHAVHLVPEERLTSTLWTVHYATASHKLITTP